MTISLSVPCSSPLARGKVSLLAGHCYYHRVYAGLTVNCLKEFLRFLSGLCVKNKKKRPPFNKIKVKYRVVKKCRAQEI